jgi:superfamily II DNA or RNA helicase
VSEPFDPFSIFPLPPHDWQRRAHAAIMPILLARPVTESVILHAATGAGKTWIQIAILHDVLHRIDTGPAAGRAGEFRVIVSVPRQSLVEQTVAEARAFLPRSKIPGLPTVGAWYANANEDARIIVVCHDSVPGLISSLCGKPVVFWMFDEVHKANSDAMVALRAQVAPKVVLGVTATPFTSDRRNPLRGWTRVAFSYPIGAPGKPGTAIGDGVLVPFRTVLPTDEEDSWEDTNAACISMIRRGAPPGPGIVSAVNMIDAEWFAGVLSENGIPATFIHSALSKSEQLARIDALLRGVFRAIVHVDLLTEGRDIRGLRWLCERRDRKSAVAIVQAAGRVLRVCRADDPTVVWAGPKHEAVILLPHPTKLDRSIARLASTTPHLSAAAYEKAAAKEQTEPKGTVATLPPAEAAVMVDAWIRALPDAVASAGIAVPAPYILIDGGEYDAPTTHEQIQKLVELTENGHRSPVRFLPIEHRKLLKAVLARTEHLNRGQLAHILRTLVGLNRYKGRFYSDHRHLPQPDCWWKGLDSIPLAAPEVLLKSVKRKAKVEP